MRSTLRISQRGIILVLIPLAFELIFVGVLAWLLNDARQQMWEERRARAVASILTLLSRQTQTSALILARYSDSRDPQLLRRWEQLMTRAPGEFAELKALVKDKPADLKAVLDLETTYRGAMEVMDKCKTTFGTDDSFARFTYYPKLYRAAHDAERQMDTLVERYIAKETAGKESFERAGQQVTFWLCLGVILNVALALSLALFFSRGITKRLSVLVDNTFRLASHKPLNERLSGEDEIAELDRVFHAMAEALDDAAKKKQEFVSMISHDLRTPLTAVQGTLTLLDDGMYGKLSDVGQKRVRTAEQEVGRLINLINNLLDVERLEAGQMQLALQDTEVSSILKDAVEAMRPFAESKKIELDLDAAEMNAKVDRDRLMQVVINLISNAIKFSNADGKVHFALESENKHFVIRVQDWGRGIPASVGQSIFDRWRQVKASDGGSSQGTSKGSGLGLAICKSIVEAHNGTIGFNSNHGEGTTFWIRLPQ
ncbi:MAG TPA: HAMP domain-containing sensor histidine kinase [Candidatus Obscuribacterales bacterium]